MRRIGGQRPPADPSKIDFRAARGKGTRVAPRRYPACASPPVRGEGPSSERWCVLANLLTAARVVLIFVIIAVWMRADAIGSGWLDLLMVPLLAWAIFMDALDGWAARRYNEASTAPA